MTLHHHLAACLIAVSVPIFAQTPGVGLKGYAIGDPMTECPDGAQPLPTPYRGMYTCHLVTSTLAGVQLRVFSVSYYQGKVSSLVAQYAPRDNMATMDIYAALTEKYGTASEALRYTMRYRWDRGQAVITLDGTNGIVSVYDRDAIVSAARAKASAAQSDL